MTPEHERAPTTAHQATERNRIVGIQPVAAWPAAGTTAVTSNRRHQAPLHLPTATSPAPQAHPGLARKKWAWSSQPQEQGHLHRGEAAPEPMSPCRARRRTSAAPRRRKNIRIWGDGYNFCISGVM
jgi:hypothetical protein